MARAAASARRLGAAAAFAAVLACGVADAAPVITQLGADRVVIDTPPGYSDTAFIGSPRLNEFAESLVPEGNRILVFALSDADVRRFSAGDTPDLRRVLLLTVPRAMERERVNAAQFVAMAREVFGNVGERAPAGADPLKYLDEKPHGIAHLIAELRNDEAVRSVLQGTRTPPRSWGDKPSYRLSTGTLARIGGKAVSLTVLTIYENAADLEWIRAVTLRWIEQLQKLNAER